MQKNIKWLNESEFIPPLSTGCQMCAQGAKLVLFITGICSNNCFYCPLSFKKGGKDLIFANEWKLENEDDIEKIIQESRYINANGAGITGGDPLIVWQRAKKYISILKDTFSSNYHIHLYTPGIKNGEHIIDLISSGLDEIRFHPHPRYWSNLEKSPIRKNIKRIKKTNIDISIEIPSIPNFEKEIFSLIKWGNKNDIKQINLNELEYSERNSMIFNKKGYTVNNDISSAVKGSHETANKVIKMVLKSNFEIGVHFCSSSFKDGIQLKRRLIRRAKSIAKPYEIITKEGMFLKGIIKVKNKKNLINDINFLKKEYQIPNYYISLDEKRSRIEIGLWILDEIADELKSLGFECFMVEEYPTVDALEIEKIPLPLKT